ncbi:MAG: PilZ domain-containing protein [Sedimentisphaerales bacterium]|nr:PilZ domain-containing protein [Sedimentisphaerales bacterium]
MSEIAMLQGHESQTVLQTVVEEQSPAILSYLSKDKWHVAKVVLRELAANRLYVEGYHSGRRPHPINIRVNQPVGVNFKHAYGKFVFDTTVVGLEPATRSDSGGTIVLAIPEEIGVVQRRSYFRVSVPESLKVNVVLWHRTGSSRVQETAHDYHEGRLLDISAGGAQIAVPLKGGPNDGPTAASESDFHKGQFLGVRFTPMPYETPLMFNVQIRNVLPTADRKALCLGLQIVGLEASEEGRHVLSRLASVVERYYDINQSSAKQQDMQTTVQADRKSFHLPAGALQ